jgi:RimJ/RimL family protein N-acetyltransferase
MAALETTRLLIRPLALEDLNAVYELLDVDLRDAKLGSEKAHSLEERREWLEWTVMSYTQYARLFQPPYGERAVVLRRTGELLGLVGYVPCLNVFEQLPGFADAVVSPERAGATAEVGLFYAIRPAHQRQGYAAEAAQAMIDYAFQQLRLKRIVATTSYDNAGSLGVMRRLGMRIETNPYLDPPWLQAVGVLENWALGT